jgi:hypothetical protein
MRTRSPNHGAARLRPLRLAAAVAFGLACAGSIPADGMIRTLRLADLIRQSDTILTATVGRVREVGKGTAYGQPILMLSTELTPTDVLKGPWPAATPVILATIKPETGWIEDNVELPPTGSQVLLFLARLPDGRVAPVNGIQGVWPIADGTFRGMGTGRNLDDVRAGVKRAGAAVVFDEGVALQKTGDLKGALERYRRSLADWPDAQLQAQTARLEASLKGQRTSLFGRDEIPCGQADVQERTVPPDFALREERGGGIAGNLGASSIAVNAAGAVTRTPGAMPNAGGTPAPPRAIPPAGVVRIYAQVLACGFFDLNPRYDTPGVSDGPSMSLTVTAGARTHAVSVSSFGVDRVATIIDVLTQEIEASGRGGAPGSPRR